MSTVKRIEQGIAALLEDSAYRSGAAWDQEAMKAFFSDSGAVVVQVTAINPAHQANPELPDFRADVVIRGRTSMATDKDKRQNNRIASLVSAKVAKLTAAKLSEALGVTVAAWLGGGMSRATVEEDHQFEIKRTMIILDLVFEEETREA